MSKVPAILVTLALAQSAFAQSAAPARATVRFGTLRQDGGPYRKLFAEPAITSAAAEAMPKKKVVCGLTIIEGDASIDPKMAKTFPKKDGVAHTIRSIDPATCKP